MFPQQFVISLMESREDYHSRLCRIYRHYAPDKLGNVDRVLEVYRGLEVEMFSALTGKYGPEPPIPLDLPNSDTPASFRLVRFFRRHMPERVHTVDDVIARFAGREQVLLTSLVAKYGPEPADTDTFPDSEPAPLQQQVTPSDDVRARLVRFYQRYAPERISGADEVLARFAGRERELMTALVAKYGPEPPFATFARTTTMSDGGEAETKQRTEESPSVSPLCRERMVRFYQRYAPDKIPLIDQTLARYAGREQELWSALVAKYGPEPNCFCDVR